MKLTTKRENDWDTNIPLWERSKDHLIGEIRGHPLLPVENVNDVIINSSLAIFLSIQSAVVWSENNLNWTKTSTTLTDSDIGFFPSPTYKHSLHDEYAVNQSDISWWLNKLFDFWIILRLTEFEMWACLQCLAGTKKDELCYWQRRLANDIFYHYSPVLNSCFLWPIPAACMGASRPGSKVQFIIFSLDSCELLHSMGWLFCLGEKTYFLLQSRNIVHYIRGFDNLHNAPNE